MACMWKSSLRGTLRDELAGVDVAGGDDAVKGRIDLFKGFSS